MTASKHHRKPRWAIGGRRRPWAVVLLLGAALAAQAGDVSPAPSTPGTRSVGFLGDRTGVYPDSRPPIHWADYEPVIKDHKPAPGRLVNRNIVWRADLANWGNGAPVPVGDRVFVVCEPGWKHVWPVLQCFALKDGELLWERELDPLDALSISPEEKKELLATWKEYWRLQREHWQRTYQITGAAKEDRERLAEKFKAEEKSHAVSPGTSGCVTGSKEQKDIRDRLKKWFKTTGITAETWNFDFGTWVVGYASPTPVSDGERIYVATRLAAFFCFDLDGKRLWVQAKPGIGAHFCNHYRSPLLYGDLFISDEDSRPLWEPLWWGVKGKRPTNGSYSGLVYNRRKLYCDHAEAVLDPLAGTEMAGGAGFGAVPRKQHDGTWMVIAGQHLYGMGYRRGDPTRGANATVPFRNMSVVEVFTLDGRKVTENYLWTPLPQGEKLEQIKCMEGLGGWNWFNQSGFISVQGDRLFIRSNDELWCIGHVTAGLPSDDPKTVAAIRVLGDAQGVLPYLGHASAQYRLEAARRLGALKANLTGPVQEALQERVVEDAYPEIRAAAEGWAKDKSDMTGRILPDYYASIDAASDPVAAEELIKRYPGEWRFYDTFARHLPPERFVAWLETIALASGHPNSRTRILEAWKRLETKAIPSMERCASALTADPNAKDAAQRADWAKVIADAVLEAKGLKKPKVEEERETRDD